MPDDSASTTTSETKTSKKNGLARFIKQNKTLSLIIAGGSIYLLYEYEKGKGSSEPEPGEVESSGGSGESAGYVGPLSPASEGGNTEAPATAAEIEEIRNEIRELERENERTGEKTEPETTTPTTPEPGGSSSEPAPTQSGASISIHGKEFVGAVSSRIGKSGTTKGGKKYIEYVITYPGRMVRYQYYVATGNWRLVSDSSTGPASNKPPATGGGKGGGGGGQPAPVKAEHPKAVKTGNKCVNGGVGKHKAPAGYHLFCGSDGWIYRAPNA